MAAQSFLLLTTGCLGLSPFARFTFSLSPGARLSLGAGTGFCGFLLLTAASLGGDGLNFGEAEAGRASDALSLRYFEAADHRVE